jgi:hypothetical protein
LVVLEQRHENAPFKALVEFLDNLVGHDNPVVGQVSARLQERLGALVHAAENCL